MGVLPAYYICAPSLCLVSSQRPEKVLGPLGLELQVVVIEIKPSAFGCLAISPAPEGIFLYLFILSTGPHYTVPAVPKFSLQTRLPSSSEILCCLPRAGVKGMYHHVLPEAKGF